jgi:hypothetical protein
MNTVLGPLWPAGARVAPGRRPPHLDRTGSTARTSARLGGCGRDRVVSPAGRAEGSFVKIVVVAAVSAGLSLAALVVSVILAWRQADLQALWVILARRQTELQARIAAIEEARRAEEVIARGRARVTARFDLSFQVLCLTNDGPATAQGVTVEVRPIGGGEPPALDLRELPMDLRPGQQLFLDAQHASPDHATSMTATVRWADDTGAQDENFVLNTRF